MIRRTFDTADANAIANHPEVRPTVGGEGVLDLAPLIDNPANVALRYNGGLFVFSLDEPGRYELHTMALPEGRGRAVQDAAAEAARYMFVQTPCVEIVTRVFTENRAADFMVRRCGFSPVSPGPKQTVFALTLDAWRAHDTELASAGAAFHDALEAAKAATGSALPTHDDDASHDRAAGAAFLMAKAGNVKKAAWSYNRWARLSGYQPITLLSEAPVLADVQDALVTFNAGEMEILQCR